jgi:hypothetical protein
VDVVLHRLGVTGIVGVVLVLVGIGTVAIQNIVIASGMAFVLAGVGLVATGIIRSAMASFGMA